MAVGSQVNVCYDLLTEGVEIARCGTEVKAECFDPADNQWLNFTIAKGLISKSTPKRQSRVRLFSMFSHVDIALL
jgi:hypothetical protein